MDCVFAVNGNTYKIQLYFGQGSKGLNNNWWFGSQSISESKELVLRDPNGKEVAVYRLSGDTSDLVLTKV